MQSLTDKNDKNLIIPDKAFFIDSDDESHDKQKLYDLQFENTKLKKQVDRDRAAF